MKTGNRFQLDFIGKGIDSNRIFGSSHILFLNIKIVQEIKNIL